MQKKYIAPNAITVTNMFLGYLSIISSTKGEFDKAVLFIFLAMICDGLDGKVARKFDAFSEFGKEFDSFCDAISFGIAPSIFIYSLLGRMENAKGYVIPISFIYGLCGIMRLVKFNIQTIASNEKEDFSGMPIPAGASLIISYYIISKTILINFGINILTWEALTVLSIIAGGLMVSIIPFKTPDKIFSFLKKSKILLSVFLFLIMLTFNYSFFALIVYYISLNIIKIIKLNFGKDYV